MPTPLEIILDPISLGIIALYTGLILVEHLIPARKLKPVKGWKIRALLSFSVFFFLSAYLPLLWDQYLLKYQIIDLSRYSDFTGIIISLLVFELLVYIWHRTMHNVNFLWRMFHQMHHSAENIDSYGAFYYSPLDMVGFTMVSSLSLTIFAGLSAQAVTIFLFISVFLVIFQHLNIKTPQWIGYIIQRPESHTVHHKKNVHAFNYSDFPIFDIIFWNLQKSKKFRKGNRIL